PISDQRTQLRPDMGVEGMPFDDLDVIDAELSRPPIEPKHAIARIADIADDYLYASGALDRSARQNRLVRAAAGAPNAPELEHANGFHRLGAAWGSGPRSR